MSVSSQNDVRKAHHRHDIGMNKHGQAPEIRGVEPSESINFSDERGGASKLFVDE